jgi:hypothetical protein
MKAFSHLSAAVIGIILGSALLFSCEKENVQPLTEREEIEIAESSSSLESATLEEIQNIQQVLTENPEGGRTAAGCARVTRDAEQKIITIDFGSGCVGPFGRERKGMIIVHYGGSFNDLLANRVITFKNYFVNNKSVSGTIELRDFNLVNDHLTYTRKHEDLKVTFPAGHSVTSNGSTTITWLEGEGDDDVTNDVYSITGAYTGITSRGITITRTITEALVVNIKCLSEGGFSIVAGKIEVKVMNRKREQVRTIEYGDGACDHTITVTVNGVVHDITIS